MILTICLVFVLPGPALTGDMTHTPDRDFDTLRAAGNRNPTGIWSDGTTMLVADGYRHKIYAYNMRSKARDRGRDFDLAAGNTSPTGIWSELLGRTLKHSHGAIGVVPGRKRASSWKQPGDSKKS